jgi:hypothetical protein
VDSVWDSRGGRPSRSPRGRSPGLHRGPGLPRGARSAEWVATTRRPGAVAATAGRRPQRAGADGARRAQVGAPFNTARSRGAARTAGV